MALALDIPSYARKFADAWTAETDASRTDLMHVPTAAGHLDPKRAREEDEQVAGLRFDERAMLGILLNKPQKDWRRRNVQFVYLDGDDKRSLRIVTGYSESTREALGHAFGDDDPSWTVVPGYADEPAWIS